MIVRKRGSGMRWRGSVGRAGAVAGRVGERPVSGRTARRTTGAEAYGKSVWA